eukprot:12882234-Prorocentrum_lima.AAC.1
MASRRSPDITSADPELQRSVSNARFPSALGVPQDSPLAVAEELRGQVLRWSEVEIRNIIQQ